MKKLISALLATVMTITMSACASTSSTAPSSANVASPVASSATPAAPAKVRTLQLGHLDPSTDDNAYQVFCTTFAKKLSDLSGGALQVDIFGDAQLGGEVEMFESMSLGDLDMAIITNNYYNNFDKNFMVFDLPFIFADYEEAHQVLDDEEILGYLRKGLLDRWNVRLLVYSDSGFRYIVNNKRPIKDVADIAGIKIRLPETTLYVKTFQALGANPTTMAFSEAYTAVQQGTVDGLEITASAINSAGYYQICKYLSKTAHFYSPISLDISEKVWQSFSEQEQGWVMKAAQEARDEARVKVISNEQVLLDKMEAAGCAINEINDVAEFQKTTAPVFDYIRGEIGNDLLDMVLAKLGR